MLEIKLIATYFVGAFAAFIGSQVGSGGLISIPFLIFLGLPPQVAIATNKFGAIGLAIGALARFIKSKEIVWEYVIWFSLLALIASQIGAKILLELDEALLQKIIVAIMLLVLPTIFFKKDIGTVDKKITGLKKVAGFVLYFFILVWQAFFGAGAATMIFYIMMIFFGMTINQASATHKIPGFVVSFGSLIVFIAHGIVNWPLGIAMFLGMLTGGYIGAHTALKKGNAWVKMLFAIMVIVSALKLLFG